MGRLRVSNETKRDVFETFADERAGLNDEIYKRYLNQYDNALPDDLPTIPEAVGEHIRWCKGEGGVDNVSDAMDYTYGDVAEWLYDERNSDTFARAWLLGVWRVDETGEIVKLEAEK